MTHTLNIDELIDNRPIGKLQWRVVAICFLLAVIDGFDASTIGYVAPILSEQFTIEPDQMGILLAAALVGLMFGAFIGSPVADRVGRKPVIVVSIIIMGAFSLLTAFAESTNELLIYRFLTGLGLGGVMPAINILTAEFAPERRRALLMTLMFTGLPAGTIVGGLASVGLLKIYTWEAVFIAGGILPFLLLPITLWLLPESPRFLVMKANRTRELSDIVNGLDSTISANDQTNFETSQKMSETVGIKALFAEGRTRLTLLLWLIFFANLLTIFGLMGWMPSVLSAAGFPLDRAILASVLLAVGGIVGGLTMAVCIDRFGPVRSMSAGFLAATLMVSVVGYSTGSLMILLLVLFLAGFTTMGCQFGLNAMASASYDTSARATGLGFALAIGRIGAIIGPILVGTFLAMELGLSTLFMLGAIPMLFSAGAVWLIGKFRPDSN